MAKITGKRVLKASVEPYTKDDGAINANFVSNSQNFNRIEFAVMYDTRQMDFVKADGTRVNISTYDADAQTYPVPREYRYLDFGATEQQITQSEESWLYANTFKSATTAKIIGTPIINAEFYDLYEMAGDNFIKKDTNTAPNFDLGLVQLANGSHTFAVKANSSSPYVKESAFSNFVSLDVNVSRIAEDTYKIKKNVVLALPSKQGLWSKSVEFSNGDTSYTEMSYKSDGLYFGDTIVYRYRTSSWDDDSYREINVDAQNVDNDYLEWFNQATTTELEANTYLFAEELPSFWAQGYSTEIVQPLAFTSDGETFTALRVIHTDNGLQMYGLAQSNNQYKKFYDESATPKWSAELCIDVATAQTVSVRFFEWFDLSTTTDFNELRMQHAHYDISQRYVLPKTINTFGNLIGNVLYDRNGRLSAKDGEVYYTRDDIEYNVFTDIGTSTRATTSDTINTTRYFKQILDSMTIEAGTYTFKSSVWLPTSEGTKTQELEFMVQGYLLKDAIIFAPTYIEYSPYALAYDGTWYTGYQSITLNTAQNVAQWFGEWFFDNIQ